MTTIIFVIGTLLGVSSMFLVLNVTINKEIKLSFVNKSLYGFNLFLGGCFGLMITYVVLLLISLSVDFKTIETKTYDIVSVSEYGYNRYLIEYLDENCDTVRIQPGIQRVTISECSSDLEIETITPLYKNYHIRTIKDTLYNFTVGKNNIKKFNKL